MKTRISLLAVLAWIVALSCASQATADCTFTLSPGEAVHGPGSETGLVSIATLDGCEWTATNTNEWISLTSNTNGTGNGDFGYTVAANPSIFSRTGLVFVADQVFAIRQSGATCTFTLSPVAAVHGPGSETGLVSVATLDGCEWAVTSTNGWITITSNTNGTGNCSFGYSVAANPSILNRTGLVFVADQVFAVRQSGVTCTFTLSPVAAVHGPGSETGLVSVATLDGCEWAVTSTNGWITITSNTNGTGNGSFGYTVAANPSILNRTGLVFVADQVFAIRQSGVTCTFTLSPDEAVQGPGPETGLVSVATLDGCEWTATSTNDWIILTSSTIGVGNGSFGYIVAPNPSILNRTGLVFVADQVFAIRQSRVGCTFTLSPVEAVHGPGSETGLVSIATLDGCEWTVTSTNDWIILTSSTNGVGNGSFGYIVAPNPSILNRTGLVFVADQLLTICQSGIACTFTLSPAEALHGPGSETGLVSVATLDGCEWTVTSTNDWITLTSSANGVGNGSFGYTVAANNSLLSRTGLVFVADQLLTIRQSGIACTFTLSPAEALHGPGSETGLVSVATLGGCEWTVTSSNDWITLTSSTNGTGSGSFGYTVAANNSLLSRTGLVFVADQLLTIRQAGAACSFTLSPTEAIHGPGLETGLVSIATLDGCQWAVTSSDDWITITSSTNGTGRGSFGYTVAANNSLLSRTGLVFVADQLLTIRQSGIACTFTLSPAEALHGLGSETGLVSIATLDGCEWAVTSSNDWITITSSTNGTGSGSFGYTVAANNSLLSRTGLVFVADQLLTIRQSGIACTFTLSPAEALHGLGSETGLVSIATLDGCEWAVTSTNDWITITSSTNGVDSGSFGYIVAANNSLLSRTGLVFVADQLLTIRQSGIACSFTLSPAEALHGPGSETGLVSIATLDGCEWTVTSTNDWITITSSTNGVGNGSFGYTVAANNSLLSRTGLVFVADQLLTIRQSGIACSFTLSPAEAVHGPGSETGLVSIATLDGCEWAVTSTNDWISLTSSTNGVGNGSFSYTVAANPNPLLRIGIVSVADQSFTITNLGGLTLSCPPDKVAEYGSPWNFDIPTTASGCTDSNATLQVVSTVTNRMGFCGNTFSVTRTWQASDLCGNTGSCMQTVQVVDTTPPVLNCTANKAIVCGTAWTFDPPTAFDASDGTNVTLSVVSTVTNGTCGQAFTATRTWSATDQCLNSSTCSQTVTNRKVVIAGTIYNPILYPSTAPSDKPVAAVPVSLTGDASQVTETASDGTYSFTVDAGGNYTVTPNQPASDPPANGVTTLDISLIRRDILGLAGLDSPYKVLAGDVNGSRSVSTLDIAQIRRLVLGTTNVLPIGLWRLVPASYIFADPLNPWDAPSSRGYTNLLADSSQEDFVAIRLGDVNDSWTPNGKSAATLNAPEPQPAGVSSPTVAPSSSPSPEVGFQVSRHTNQPGDTVTAQITVSGFREVTSVQFTLAWDPTVLRYLNSREYGLPGLSGGNFGTNLIKSGKLTFSWDNPSAAGVTVADGTVIFSLQFVVSGLAGAVSPLALVDSASQREVGVNFAPAAFHTEDGQVTVGGARLAQAVYHQGVFSVSVPTVLDQPYVLEFTAVLPATNWVALPAVIGNGQVMVLTDPAAATNGSRFYRVRVF